MKNINSLSHTAWNCKYHIVFYGSNRRKILRILGELCRWKDVKIISVEACPDHIHM